MHISHTSMIQSVADAKASICTAVASAAADFINFACEDDANDTLVSLQTQLY